MQCERGIWTMWCQICLFLVTAVLALSERTALIFCLVHFFLIGQTLWAWLSIGLILSGSVVQVMSFRWCMLDAKKVTVSMIIIHILHMGIFARLWKCMWSLWRQKDKGMGMCALVMQQADMSALRLLEVLFTSLPQTLLLMYILLTSEQGLHSPVSLSSGLCLLSLSWALVLYSRACSLLRPGHVPMPPAAILCQLVWRASMLGARITSLVFFTRVFTWWVCGLIGFHWLIASFWLVSQQTDIIRSPGRWRLFNCILGALHVFFFLNVKDGPCRFRMATFYVVMLLENFALLLSASDIVAEASWSSLWIPTAALSSFLIGIISVTVYYRFLHPKSTEILQSLHRSQSAQARQDQISSAGEKSVPDPSVHRHGTFSITGYGHSLGQSEPSELSTEKPSVIPTHHHWLLICLALKTGDWSKVTLAYGPEALAALLDVNDQPKCLIEPLDLESAPTHGNEEQLSDKRESQYVTVSSSGRHSPSSEDNREDMEKKPDSDGSDAGPSRGCPEGRSGLEGSVEMDCDHDDSDTTLYFSADPTTPHCATNVPVVVKDTNSEAMAHLSPVPNPEPPQLGTKEMLIREPCFTSTPKHELKTKGHFGPRPTAFRRQVQFK